MSVATGAGIDPAPTVRRAIAAATARFGFSATARLDAELLMAAALGVSREAMLLGRLDDPAPAGFAALADRRAAEEPVAYLTGTRGFWSIDLTVGPGALIPRADSETLIEAAIAHFGASPPGTLLDLGTGPGTLLCALLAEWPRARGLGVDRSAAALGYAGGNVARLGLGERAALVRGDWATALAGRFGCVVANPPYVATGAVLPREVGEYEPAAALFAGDDGLDAYRALVPALPRLLLPGGAALLEIGAGQGAAVAALVGRAGLVAAVRRDLAGRERCVVATAA